MSRKECFWHLMFIVAIALLWSLLAHLIWNLWVDDPQPPPEYSYDCDDVPYVYEEANCG